MLLGAYMLILDRYPEAFRAESPHNITRVIGNVRAVLAVWASSVDKMSFLTAKKLMSGIDALATSISGGSRASLSWGRNGT